MVICQNCGKTLTLITGAAETYCQYCGVVYQTKIFESGNTVKESQLPLKEATSVTGLKGSGILKGNGKISYLGNWHNRMRVTSVKEKNINFANAEIERLAVAHNLSRYLKTEIFNIFNELLEQGFTKGKSIPAIICSLTYMTSIRQSIPLNFDALVETLSLKKKRVSKMYKQLVKQLPAYAILQSPATFITKYTHYLDTSLVNRQKVKETATALTGPLETLSKSGKGPNAFSATLVWCVAKMMQIPFAEKKYIESTKLTAITIVNKAVLIYDALLTNPQLIPVFVTVDKVKSLKLSTEK